MAISNFIPTIWSETLATALDQRYIAVSNCNRSYEGEIREKGSVVKICGVGSVTVGDYTKNTDMTAPQALSDTVAELAINQAKYFNFQIDDIDRAQCSPKLMSEAMRVAASALAQTADRYVFGLYAQAGSTIKATVTASNILDQLIAARTALYTQGVSDMSDVVIEVAPQIAELILKAKIDIAKDNGEALEAGCLGSVGGCKIFVSPNVATEEDKTNKVMYYKCLARTKRAVAFAEQLSEINAYRPEKRFADAVKGLHLYGAKTVYPNEMVLLNLGIAQSSAS